MRFPDLHCPAGWNDAQSFAAGFLILRVVDFECRWDSLTLEEERGCSRITWYLSTLLKVMLLYLKMGLLFNLIYPLGNFLFAHGSSLHLNREDSEIFLFWASLFRGLQVLVFRFLKDIFTKNPLLPSDLCTGISGMEFVIFHLLLLLIACIC